MDVRLPDGTVIKDVPDDISKADLAAKLQSNGMAVPKEWLSPPTPKRSLGQELARQAGLTARAVVKGVAAPGEMLGSAVGLDTSGAVDRLMKKAGLPEPETPLERVVGGASEGLVGAAVPLGALKAVKPIEETGKAIKAALTAQPAAQAVSAAASGAAGQGAKETGFGPVGQGIASLAAGAAPFAVMGKGGVSIPRNLKEQTFADARAHGYVATPSALVPEGFSKMVEGISSKEKLTARTSSINSTARANDIRQELGLGGGDHIAPAELDEVRETAYRAYENLIDKLKQSPPQVTPDGHIVPQGSVLPTKEFKDAISKIIDQSVGLKDKYPETVEAPLRKALDRQAKELFQYHDAGDAVELVKNLRAQASSNLSAPTGKKIGPREQALGQFQYKAANAIEDLIEKSLKDPEAIAAMRQARKTIAQTYDVQYALNPATGEVSGQKLALRQRGGSPMTGSLKRAADFYNAFPRDNKEMSRVGGVPTYNAWDFLVSGGTAMAGHPGLAVAELASRGLIQPILASEMYQNRLLSSSKGGQSGLTPAMIDALIQSTNR